MTLASGILSMEDQACQVLVINILMFVYMFGLGMMQCACTLVGNQIGKGNAFEAIDYFKKIMLASIIIFSVLTVVTWIHFDFILEILTQIEEIQNLARKLRFMICLNIIPDCLAGMLRGVFKGLGIQAKLIKPHIIYFGFLSTLCTWYFCFYLDLGLIGIWIAKTVVAVLINIAYLIILYKTDWFLVSQNCYKRES